MEIAGARGVAVGVPTTGPPTWKLVHSLVGLQANCAGPFVFSRVDGLAFDMARNQLVETFLANAPAGCDHLLQIDRDAIIHPATANRLLAWDVDIVSALAFTRYRPVVPTVYREQHPDHEDKYKIQIAETRDWIRRHEALWTNEPVVLEPRPDDALVEVDFTGCHCLLVHRRVFEALEPPWFKVFAIDPKRYGEDRYFCEKAKAAGFKIHVDRSVMAGHLYGEQSLAALDFLMQDACVDWRAGEIRIPDKVDDTPEGVGLEETFRRFG